MSDIILSAKLIGLGVLGQLIHIALKYRKVKDSVSIVNYFKIEWLNIFINLLCLLAVVFTRHEIPKIKGLEWVENTLCIGMLFIGYCGQSILVSIFSKLEKKINTDEQAN